MLRRGGVREQHSKCKNLNNVGYDARDEVPEAVAARIFSRRAEDIHSDDDCDARAQEPPNVRMVAGAVKRVFPVAFIRHKGIHAKFQQYSDYLDVSAFTGVAYRRATTVTCNSCAPIPRGHMRQ